MKTILTIAGAAIVAALSHVPVAEAQDVSPKLAREIAQETYIWGYPLLILEVTRNIRINTKVPGSNIALAPINQFSHAKAFPAIDFRAVARPNFDTLYSAAFLDLKSGPQVMKLPKTDRYHQFQLMDAWSEVFAAPGTRADGGQGGTYLFVGPEWRGQVPKGMTLLQSPTNHVWIVGRVLTNGPSDYENVYKLQTQMALVPFDRWRTTYVPPKVKVDPQIDTTTPPAIAVNRMSGETFFSTLMEALKQDPPLIHDRGIVMRMKRIGLEPGKSLNFQTLPAPVQQALNAAPNIALKAIRDRASNLGSRRNGWMAIVGAIGYFGADYLNRAAAALEYPGTNRPEDAIYVATEKDQDGNPLSGANRYVVHFPKGQTPPVDAFWSITLYDNQGFSVPNPIDRQAIGDRDNLKFNDDGSLTLYIQNRSPGTDKESNWLPAPEGLFNLTMRCYSPRPEIASGEWAPPGVAMVK